MKNILINSREFQIESDMISYQQIIEKAYPDVDLSSHNVSIIYTTDIKEPFRQSGIISPNDSPIKITEGMRINATVTCNG